MNLHHAVLVAIVLGAATPAYSGLLQSTIVGGTEVSADDPVAASTVIVTDGNYICTGSIIDQDMIVTAAHCVSAAPEDLKIIFARNLDKITKTHVRLVTGYVANPKWQGAASQGVDQGDIAVIQINGSLPDGYQPAVLLPSDQSAAIGKGDVALLAGYGITDAETQDGAGVLREASVTVTSQLGETEVVLDQTQGSGACHGDSGGPAFMQIGGKLFLWGVTNRGYPDDAPDDCAHEAVYTRIEAYADWISQAENQLRSGGDSGIAFSFLKP